MTKAAKLERLAALRRAIERIRRLGPEVGGRDGAR